MVRWHTVRWHTHIVFVAGSALMQHIGGKLMVFQSCPPTLGRQVVPLLISSGVVQFSLYSRLG